MKRENVTWPLPRPLTSWAAHAAIRQCVQELEGAFEKFKPHSKIAKEMDKAIVVMKVGLKIQKKALRKANVSSAPIAVLRKA
jgi:hypothetical protein